MKKEDILKKSGLSESEFYKKYPTAAHWHASQNNDASKSQSKKVPKRNKYANGTSPYGVTPYVEQLDEYGNPINVKTGI